MFGRCEAPCLARHLNRVPWAAEGRGIAEVEVGDLIDGQSVEESGCKHVDALGNFRSPKAHELRSEQASCLQVSSDTGAKRRSTGVVGFVVVHRALYGEGLKAFAFGLILPQPGPSNDTIKDLDDLRSERARELALSAYGVLACRSALLMGGGSKRVGRYAG